MWDKIRSICWFLVNISSLILAALISLCTHREGIAGEQGDKTSNKCNLVSPFHCCHFSREFICEAKVFLQNSIITVSCRPQKYNPWLWIILTWKYYRTECWNILTWNNKAKPICCMQFWDNTVVFEVQALAKWFPKPIWTVALG